MSQAEPWEALQQEEGRPVLLTGLPITAQPCSLMGFPFSAPTLGEVSVTPRGNKNTGERDLACSRPYGPPSKLGQTPEDEPGVAC